MDNLLRPHHFNQEEKPKKEDFEVSGGIRKDIWEYVDPNSTEIRYYNKYLFEKALQDWEAKYVRPQYEWLRFDKKIPQLGQRIYLRTNENFEFSGQAKVDDEHFTIEWLRNHYDNWTCAKSYDKCLAYYLDHQVRYEGFEVDFDGENGTYMSNDNGDTIKWFGSGEFELYFWNKKGEKKIILYLDHVPTITQFESLTGLKAKEV